MGILKNTFLIIILALFTACTEDFDPNITSKPVLCLNSLITAGEPIDVSITHTWLYTDINGEKDNSVDDAKINILVNEKSVTDDYKPKEGDNVRIIAESNIYGHAESEVSVPKSTIISSVEHTIEIKNLTEWDEFGDKARIYILNIKAKMTIEDNAERDDFYLFTFKGYSDVNENEEEGMVETTTVKFVSCEFNSNSEPIFAEHLDELDAITGNESYGFTFFSDRQISGKKYTLNLQFNNVQFYMKNIERPEDVLNCGIILKLNTISQSYYNWCNYLWNSSMGTLGDLSQIGLVDPIWAYSNVSTGAGVVAAQSSTSYFINLKDFFVQEMFPPQ